MTNSKRSAHNHDAAAVEIVGENSQFPARRRQLLRSMSPLLAQSGHPTIARQCPLLGLKGTSARLIGLGHWCGKAVIRCFSPQVGQFLLLSAHTEEIL